LIFLADASNYFFHKERPHFKRMRPRYFASIGFSLLLIVWLRAAISGHWWVLYWWFDIYWLCIYRKNIWKYKK